MRPTGRLHIGHYFGALQNWVRLQNDPAYDCFYFIADWHALTSDYADTSAIAENTLQIMIDYLAAGLDPAKSVIFQQSVIPEHAELHLLLSMVTPLGWLERVPTYKEALENVKDKDLHNYGFLGYPILQCADIVIYGEPGAQLFVPVGEDQVSHVEISREIVHRFNSFFSWKIFRDRFLLSENLSTVGSLFTRLALFSPPGAPQWKDEAGHAVVSPDVVNWIAQAVPKVAAQIGAKNLLDQNPRFRDLIAFVPILAEPDEMLTKTPRIPGLDGRKMSK